MNTINEAAERDSSFEKWFGASTDQTPQYLAMQYWVTEAWNAAWQARATLPPPSGEAVRHEMRMCAPNGHKGPWSHASDSAYAKFSVSPDIGDGFTYETRALFDHAVLLMVQQCECGACEWRDYYTGPNVTHQICAECSFKVAIQRAEPAPSGVSALPFAILDDEIAALKRFHECACDGEGYDVSKEMMRRLAEIGLVRRASGNYYEHTDFGLSILNGDFDATPGIGQLAPAPEMQASHGTVTDAPVDIYGKPVAWRVHLRAKGEASLVDYDQPALFKVERSAISWMHEQIDFKGWHGAWMEPLYLRPTPASADSAADARDAWISVDDRLPGRQGQDSEEVLCFLSGHCSSSDMECRQGAGWGIRLGYYDAEKGMFRTHGRPDESVTHWQPLPAPPNTPPARELANPVEPPPQEHDALADVKIDEKGPI